MKQPPTTHDDGLEWLRDIRRKLLQDAGGDLKRLGEHYRRVEAMEQDKVRDPRRLLADATRNVGL